MRTIAEVVVAVGRIERTELVRWVERGWIVPARGAKPVRDGSDLLFSDTDIARVCMICDLRQDMMVEEDTLPVVLSLLDQMYALRRQMKTLTAAVQEQPDEVREAILERVREADKT